MRSALVPVPTALVEVEEEEEEVVVVVEVEVAAPPLEMAVLLLHPAAGTAAGDGATAAAAQRIA